ncbi:MAG: hypothetical protein D8B57_02030 [Prevotella sp.]|nr:MAG: hypothetical protein D8B57_02030 [Prevotella sp.]
MSKEPLLYVKSVGFTSPNSLFRNAKVQSSLFNKIIFTNSRTFFIHSFQQEQENSSTNKLLQN